MGFETYTNNVPQDTSKMVEVLGSTYEYVTTQSLSPDQIASDDRVFISTQSGNRYMVRRSKSRNGALMIYNKKEGFKIGYPIHDQHAHIADVSKGLNIWIVTDEAQKLGKQIMSTDVTYIEIRKGVDTILNSTPDSEKTTSFADMLKKQTGETRQK